MITIKEIAKKCNVSPATVSNVLNEKNVVADETKEKILKVVAELGYQPNYIAQGLRRKKTNMVGIIAEEIIQFSTAQMVESIMSYCEKNGYKTILENLRLYARWGKNKKAGEENLSIIQRSAFQRLLSFKVDGIIYIGGHTRVIKNFPENPTVPIVIAYGYDSKRSFPSVVVDDEQAGYDAAMHLISMGHKKIGVIGGRKDNIHAQERIIGYQRALYEVGLPYNPDWIKYGDWESMGGYEKAGSLIDAGVTAIFCLNDLLAGGVYKYISEQNLKVGEDISVMGFDNRELTELFLPPLTTMNLPLDDIGRKSAEILLDAIKEPKSKQKNNAADAIKIPCNLLVRNSIQKI